MKKLTLGILFAVLVGSVSAQSERVPLSQIKSSDYSKWSVAIGAGYGYYRVNPFVYSDDPQFWDFYVKGAGDWAIPQISLEYDFNPYFGIGAHFARFGFDRAAKGANTSKDGKFINYGAVYDFTLYGSIDVTDLLLPYRKGCWSNFSFYADFGAGVGYYEGDLYDAYIPNSSVDIGILPDKNRAEGEYNGLTPMFSSFFNAEYSFGRRIALGLGAGYRTYLRDNVGGLSQNTRAIDGGSTEAQNCDGWNLALSLRMKMGSSKKMHMRDVRLTDGYDILAGRTQQDDNSAIPMILNRLQNVENTTQEIKSKVNDLERELGKLYDKIDGAKGMGTAENPWVIQGVNFAFNKTSVIDESLPILRSVLVKLIAHYNDWNELKIDGHTDAIGTDDYNYDLALRRAEAIKKFFIDNGLGEKRFVIESFGSRKPVAPNTTPDGRDNPEGRQENRRVEVYITK